ncbi:hypothetical protein TWF481_010438 [Arthrobotrys musiformis]|uniref:ABA 3 protein n=1 Tax=Arthrobotrys musiformis TaxID=47236 RepID=A0AAV9W0Y7_9PEZI
MTIDISTSSATGVDSASGPRPADSAVTLKKSRWFYPEELKNDLANFTGLSEEVKAELINTGWEYIRCVIPAWSNWDRYIAFARILISQFACEFRGDLFRPEETDDVLGYNLQTQIDIVFGGTPVHERMGREVRAFFMGTSEKASSAKTNSELFRRYTNALGFSPKDYFRHRDCDAAARLTMAAALATNDIDLSKHWYSEEQIQILSEIALGLYDSIAYFKHRAEGEISNFYAYAGGELRLEATHLYREVLWAIEAALAGEPECIHITNFVHHFGGTIHMTMRRYRFIEDGLTIGKVETPSVVSGTRKNVNLWYRVEPNTQAAKKDRYTAWIAQKERLMYDGLAECLERPDSAQCQDCIRRTSYGAEDIYQFGGVILCSKCKQQWIDFTRSLPARAAKAFPELKELPEFWE